MARRKSGGTLVCDIVHGRRGQLARASVAQNSRLVVAAEINEIEGRGGDAQVILSLVTEIEEAWLREMFPTHFQDRIQHVFDNSQNRVVVRREKVYRDLAIELQDRDADPSPAASACLAAVVLDGDLRLNQWDDAVDQWLERVNFLAAAAPDFGLPTMGETERQLIVHLACEDATSYREIKDRRFCPSPARCSPTSSRDSSTSTRPSVWNSPAAAAPRSPMRRMPTPCSARAFRIFTA